MLITLSCSAVICQSVASLVDQCGSLGSCQPQIKFCFKYLISQGKYFGPGGMRVGSGEGSTMYCSPNIVRVTKSRRLRWAGHVVKMEESRRAFKILTGKPTGKKPLGRPRHRCEDNIRIDLEEIGINAGN